MTMETIYIVALALVIFKMALAWAVWRLLGHRSFPPGFWVGLWECWKTDQRKHLDN